MGTLSQALGSIFGYGTQGVSAAQQLAAQGISGPATPNLTGFNAAQGQEGQTLGQLQGEAAGTGPSSAQAQLSSGIQQAMAAQAAAASGGRYGANANARQTNVANAAAGLEGAGADAAGQLRAQERQAGAQGAAALGTSMAGQQLGAADLGQRGQLAYNQQEAGLYGQEQGQQAQAGMGLQNNLSAGIGEAVKLATTGAAHGAVVDHHTEGMKHLAMALAHMHEASGMANGGISGALMQLAPLLMKQGGVTEVGERGPELLASTDKNRKPALIDHPMMLQLGQKSQDVVLPLKKGSAPYHAGPMRPEARPTTPAPKRPEVKKEALNAMDGRGPVHKPGPGASGLSPKTKPVVKKAMAAHGMLSALHPAVLSMLHAGTVH